jgi:WD40 repeat protein
MPRVKKPALPSASLPIQWQAVISDHVIALAWSPDGRWLTAAAVSGPISLFDGATGQCAAVLAGHHLGTTSLSWSADSTCLASTGQDGLVRLWDATTGREQQALDAGAPWVESVAWSPTGTLLATAAGRTLRLWDTAGRLQQQYPAQTSTIAALQWAPRTVQIRRAAAVLATAVYGRVTLWTPERSEPLTQFAWKGSILTLAWSPDGRYLVHGDQDATVHFWVLADGKDAQMWGYPTKVRELAWDHTSRYLATGGGPVVVVWDYAGKGPQGSKPLMLEAHEDFLSALAFQHAHPLLASGGLDGRVVVWQPGKSRLPLTQNMLDAGITQLAWAPDDQALAIGSEMGTVMVLRHSC